MKWYLGIIAVLIVAGGGVFVYQFVSVKVGSSQYATIEGKTTHKYIEPLDITAVFEVEKIVDAGAATGIVFIPDGRMLWSELNSGEIKSFRDGVIKTFAVVPDHLIPHVEGAEAGLMGMTIDYDYQNNPYVYVYYTSNGTSKIARFKDVGGRGEDLTIIFDGIRHGIIHNGGNLEFGPDSKIYVSTGDTTPVKIKLGPKNPAQNVSVLEGKILRMNRDGSLPEDNPFENSYIFAYGLRNVFTFDFHPVSQKLYVADQGIDCCEEMNIIEPGRNYGWPIEMGIVENSIYEKPIYAWDGESRVSPTGGSFYSFPGKYRNNFFMGTWKTREIYRFVLDKNGKIAEVEVYSVPRFGHENPDIESIETHESHGHFIKGILDVVEGPGGFIYFSDLTAIYRFKASL